MNDLNDSFRFLYGNVEQKLFTFVIRHFTGKLSWSDLTELLKPEADVLNKKVKNPPEKSYFKFSKKLRNFLQPPNLDNSGVVSANQASQARSLSGMFSSTFQ